MPPRRDFGIEINANSSRGPNLSSIQRGEIIAKAKAGVSTRELVEEFGRSPNCIRTTIRISRTRATTQEAPRSGRPRILTRHQEKIIFRKVRSKPKIQYKDLAAVAQLVLPDSTLQKKPSTSTLYRSLKRQGLTNYRCKERPKLNRARALARLKFCREYRKFPWSRRPLKFSDECSVQKGAGHAKEWCFRYPSEK
ncbi:hypothetical protein BDW02DRAFT_512417 [Decorospora gaudefroyi]|uniref:Transposase Tc1-like domain-containing protein n=1 Tax=Decorospora gaudefroyi TaxID=184978 RepID=A0A6A5K2G0_9PLEO|nr:hypothetical protein BDW02DRAFT_512417 [Decorospora gaudefroyi]